MTLSKTVQNFAKNNHCTIGICDAFPLDPAYLQKSAFVPFVRQDIKKRTDPDTILPGVQSIIVVGVGATAPVQNQIKSAADTAQLSSIGTNYDYHPRVKFVLDQLVSDLLQHTSFNHKILVDSPTLDERALAQKAGIGFLGRSGLIISPQFGTRFNIGLLLIDIPLKSTAVSQGKCPTACRLCINACPNGALQPERPLDAARCISYLTQKKEWTGEEKTMLHDQLFGCDICQDACPFNATPHPKTYVNPQQWLDMEDAELAEKYAHTAMLWQGTEILRRNAQAAIRLVSRRR